MIGSNANVKILSLNETKAINNYDKIFYLTERTKLMNFLYKEEFRNKTAYSLDLNYFNDNMFKIKYKEMIYKNAFLYYDIEKQPYTIFKKYKANFEEGMCFMIPILRFGYIKHKLLGEETTKKLSKNNRFLNYYNDDNGIILSFFSFDKRPPLVYGILLPKSIFRDVTDPLKIYFHEETITYDDYFDCVSDDIYNFNNLIYNECVKNDLLR